MGGLEIALIVFCSVFVLCLIIVIVPKLKGKFKTKGPKYSPVKDSPAEEPIKKKSDRLQRPVLLTSQNQKQEFETLKEQTRKETSGMASTVRQSMAAPLRPMQSRTTIYDDRNYDDPSDDTAYNSSFDANRFGRRTPMGTGTEIADDLRNLSPEMKRLLVGNVLDSKTNKDVNDRF
ncbi:MAG: hypothetical protein LBN07_03520 [Christensenellaceae bacterium]|jgi:hypothetical protein|nr:hypothetical protein [Christensenellaceae bacterium]